MPCQWGLWSFLGHPCPSHQWGTPDQSGVFLLCSVCDLHFVFIVFTIINLKTNRCAYTEMQLRNVTCRTLDSCNGLIHSAPFVGFVWFLLLYFLCRFLHVFLYILNSKRKGLCILSFSWLYSELCNFWNRKWHLNDIAWCLCWDHVHVKSFGSCTCQTSNKAAHFWRKCLWRCWINWWNIMYTFCSILFLIKLSIGWQ